MRYLAVSPVVLQYLAWMNSAHAYAVENHMRCMHVTASGNHARYDLRCGNIVRTFIVTRLRYSVFVAEVRSHLDLTQQQWLVDGSGVSKGKRMYAYPVF